MQTPFFPIYSLSSLAISPVPVNMSNRCQPYMMTPGLGAPAAILEFSRATIRLLRSWEKWGCSGQGWPWSTGLLETSSEPLASSCFHKGAFRLGWKSRNLTSSLLNSGIWSMLWFSFMLDWCSVCPCSCRSSLCFSHILGRHNIPSWGG